MSGVKIRKGPTVKDLVRQAGLTPNDDRTSLLPAKDRASDKEIAKACEQLQKRCPYLVSKRKRSSEVQQQSTGKNQ